MVGALDRDYSRSHAILIGTWEYTELHGPIPAVRNSLDRMGTLLTSEACGWPADRVTTFRNERSPGDLPDRIAETFGDVEDVALFYYVGHGQPDPDDKLCLGLVDSRTQARRRATTSLEFDDIRRALKNSNATTKIVILDCCFAGLAMDGRLTGRAVDVAELAGGTGAFTMAASGYTTAWYEVDGEAPQTYFTRYLADIVEHGGIPGQPTGLRLAPIFRQLRNNLESAGKPRPTAVNQDFAGEYVFARNTTGQPESAPPPEPDEVVANFDSIMDCSPTAIAEFTATLDRQGADQFLAAVTVRRSGQEVAALVSLLQLDGRKEDIAAIVQAAVRLPTAHVVTILAALYALGLKEDADRLLAAVPQPAAVVAELLPTLTEHEAEPLLETLSHRDIDAAAVVEALPGFHADRLIRKMLAAATTTAQIVDLFATVWPVLAADRIMPLLRDVAGRRGDGNVVIELVDKLRHIGRPVEANRLLAEVTSIWSRDGARVLVELALANRITDLTRVMSAQPTTSSEVPVDLRDVLHGVLKGDVGDLKACLTALQRTGAVAVVENMLTYVASTQHPLKIAELFGALADSDEPDVTRLLTNRVALHLRGHADDRFSMLRRKYAIMLQLKALYSVGRGTDARNLCIALVSTKDREWNAMVMEQVAANLRRTGHHTNATELTDALRPQWRRDMIWAAPGALIMQLVLGLLGRSMRPGLGDDWWRIFPLTVSALVVVCLTLGLELLLLSKPLHVMGDRRGGSASDHLLFILMTAVAIEGFVRADWLAFGTVVVGALVAYAIAKGPYDLRNMDAIIFGLFGIACVVASTLSSVWPVAFVAVLGVVTVAFVALTRSRLALVRSACITVTATAAGLHWVFPAPWPWLNTIAQAIGDVLTWKF
jgi:hypothetical protein